VVVVARVVDERERSGRGGDPDARGTRAAEAVLDQREPDREAVLEQVELQAIHVAGVKEHLLAVDGADESARAATNDLDDSARHAVTRPAVPSWIDIELLGPEKLCPSEGPHGRAIDVCWAQLERGG
jgi:hypothetical protein